MTREKYAAAIDLTVDKFGLPDFMYQQKIVSDSDKERVREIISQIKERMLHVSDRIAPGKNCVFVPFRESLKPQLPTQKAFDMTTANRFGAFLNLLPLINIDKRPTIVLRAEGNPISQVTPFALFEDLDESMFLMEYADGVRPYVLEWYYDVFLEAFNEKTVPDFRTVTNNKGEDIKVEEKMIALTTEDLVQKTKQVYNRVCTKHQIRDTYIYPLINQGYIDETDSELDKRQKILYPLIVLDKSSKNERLHDKNKSLNLFQQSKILIENHELYPSREYIISQIEALLRCVIQTPFFKTKQIKLLDHNGQQIITLDQENKEVDVAELGELVDTYYHNPEDHFHFSDGEKENNFDKNGFEISHFQNTKITSESQQNSGNDIENATQSLEEPGKLSDDKNISQSLSFPCYYCDYDTDSKEHYEGHVVMRHGHSTAYPNKAEIEKLGLKAQGKSWEQ